MKWILLSFLIFLIQGTAHAYTDQIQAEPEIIYEVARGLLSSHGFREENAEELKLETKWIKDIVKRRTSLPFVDVTLKKRIERRRRILVTLNPQEKFVEVQILGVYQFRTPTDRQQAPWKNLNTNAQEYHDERDLFFRILSGLAKKKRP